MTLDNVPVPPGYSKGQEYRPPLPSSRPIIQPRSSNDSSNVPVSPDSSNGEEYRPPLPSARPPIQSQSSNIPPSLPPRRPVGSTNPQASAIPKQTQSPTQNIPTKSVVTKGPNNIPSHLTNNATASPYPTIRTCPSKYPIYFATRWYEVPGLPEMRACSKCFEKLIRPSQFANMFKAIDESAGLARACRFNVPQLLQLWSQAVATNNFEVAKRFMEIRAKVPACPGTSGVGTGVRKWYTPVSADIPNFRACEACYYDIIQATQFSDNFRPSPEQQPIGSTFICSMSLPFIPRAIQAYSKNRAWHEFAKAAIKRLNMPPCPEKQMVVSTSRKWLRPKTQIPGFVLCETCYFDNAACSSMSLQFEYVRGNFLNNWSCGMAILPVKAAWAEAFEANNYQMWWDAARAALTAPNCSQGEIKDGTWYTLIHDPEGFDICHACYTGFIHIIGMGTYFKPRRYASGTVKACSFNTSTKRFRNYMLKLNEAIETYRFKIFTDYVHKFSHLPVCPGIDSVDHARWYGTFDYLFCPECYESLAKGTAVASRFTEVNSLLQPAYICSGYSPRMQKLWAEAVAKNDDREFGKIATHRVHIWMKTIAECRNIMAMMRMRMEQKNTLAMASIMVGGAGNIEAAASGGSRHDYGNSAVGYGFQNFAGVEGAMYGRQANSVAVVDGGEFARVGQLEALWKEVE
jgi:hypothetical protein